MKPASELKWLPFLEYPPVGQIAAKLDDAGADSVIFEVRFHARERADVARHAGRPTALMHTNGDTLRKAEVPGIKVLGNPRGRVGDALKRLRSIFAVVVAH